MKNYLFVASILTMALCNSCSEEGLGATDSTIQEFTFDGYIQKGPFITGTSVEVRELDSSLNTTGKTFSTHIKNDFGSFDIVCKSDQPYAEFIADGYYFDEVGGDLSEGELKLRAISKMDQATNINILTTLQADRMRSLIKDGKAYDEALSQSKREVLKIFNIDEDEVANFNNMNITEQGASNSILLAISSILQCDRGVAEMSELISKLSLDIADNGFVDNITLIKKIIESSKAVDVAEVIRNLEERYKELGEEVTIDNFYDFIDSDGDGELNGGEPYLFIDKSDYIFDHEASQQTIYFNANYTPRVNILSDENFIKVVSVEKTKVKLDLSSNEGQAKRKAELQFLSEDGEIVERVFVEQVSSYTEVAFNLMFGVSSRATLPNSDIDIKRITMIAFDSDGKLLFNNNDTAPKLEDRRYSLYFKFEKNYYENCSIYTIVNGSDNYSSVSTISDVEQLKSDIIGGEVLSAMTENVSFSNSRPIVDGDNEISINCPIPDVQLRYTGVSKIVFNLEFDESIAESDRVISGFNINGELYTNTYLFTELKDHLDKVTNVEINTESLNCLIGGGSVIRGVQIMSANGSSYTLEFPSDVVLEQGKQYSYQIRLSASNVDNAGITVEDASRPSGDTSISFSTSTGSTTR